MTVDKAEEAVGLAMQVIVDEIVGDNWLAGYSPSEKYAAVHAVTGEVKMALSQSNRAKHRQLALLAGKIHEFDLANPSFLAYGIKPERWMFKTM